MNTKSLSLLGLLFLVVGCEQKPATEFVTTSNGLVYRANRVTGDLTLVGGKPDVAEIVATSNGLLYRLNRQSGELCLVAGGQITKLDEPGVQKTEGSKKSYLREWPSQPLTYFADTQFNVASNQSTTNQPVLRTKSTWKDGRLYYIAAISPYPSKIKKERERQISQAQFNLDFMDEHGFELFTLPLKVSEFSGVVDEQGEVMSLKATGSVACSLDTYEELKGMIAGWGGFLKE